MLENGLEKIIPYYLSDFYLYILLYNLTIICLFLINDTFLLPTSIWSQ